ncbi:MAG: hypothetical protein V2I57_01900 [Xanthomonadales bacterium]|jgi:hypothetical protein|nr:hypothetical protein [Xanthomonadales bacterium]
MPSPAPENPGLLVLGMHRSGTSCLAGMLECAGFAVGDVDEWNPYNLKGNRENLAASAINEALLRANGGDWNVPPEHVVTAPQHQADIRRLTDELAASGKPWLLKDPRTLLVLDAWTGTIPGLGKLGIFRHPLPVAKSLQRRDDTSIEAGVALWCAYNERLLAALDAASFPLLLFNGEPEHLERAVAAALDTLFPTEIADGVLHAEQAGDFFDRSLVHHAPPLEPDVRESLNAHALGDELVERAQAVWENLLKRQGPLRLDATTAPDPSGEQAGEPLPSAVLPDDLPGADAPAQIRQLDALLEVAKQRTDLFHQGMRVFEAKQDRPGLKAWLQGWSRRLPDDPFLHWELATLHYEDDERDTAIEHAVEARRLAPGWISPTKALALWAFEAGQWKLAAETNRSLYAVQFAQAKVPPLAAELFVDSGRGFNGEEAIEQGITSSSRTVDLRFDDARLLGTLKRFRLDPLNQPVILQDLEVTLRQADGSTVAVKPSGSNAELASDGVFYFTTNDPQLHFLDELGLDGPVADIRARYRITHVGDEVAGALIRRLKALLEEAETAAQDTPSPGLSGWFRGFRSER